MIEVLVSAVSGKERENKTSHLELKRPQEFSDNLNSREYMDCQDAFRIFSIRIEILSPLVLAALYYQMHYVGLA